MIFVSVSSQESNSSSWPSPDTFATALSTAVRSVVILTFLSYIFLLSSPVSAQSPISISFPYSYGDLDIGPPGGAGSVSYGNGAWSVVGGGWDIWGSADAFNFVNKSVNSDQTMIAAVTSVTNTDSWAKAGVMFRDSLDSSAMYVDVIVTPANGVAMQCRDQYGNSLNQQIIGVTANPWAPAWVKLTKSGTTYTGYYSPDGAAWTQIGVPFTVQFNNYNYFVGLAVTAHNNALLNTATFTDVSVSANDGIGGLDPTSYRQLAQNYSSPTGITYRYGTPSGVPNYILPTAYQPPDSLFINHDNNPGWYYQLGGPQDLSKNDYNSNMGQVLFVPDQPQDTGVDALETLLMEEGTFSEKPQLPWQYYGGGHPDPQALQPEYVAANGGPLQQPTAIAHSYGLYNWDVNGLVAFQSGLIAAFGTNTSPGAVSVKLPPGKVPTAVAITDNNEFALVTVWDTNALKGQVAVLALGTGNDFWRDWTALYPGLRNNALFTFMKLLGFVDLPGMTQPTEISASTDYAASFDDIQGWFNSPDGSNIRFFAEQLTLQDEDNRQSFLYGPNQNRYSKAGFATIISKAERKVIFLDLKPLFNWVQQMYFTSRTNLAFAQAVGDNSAQWPFTFDQVPSFAPTVIATAAMAQPPTAVRTSLIPGVNQAYVGTLDGTIHIFNVGGYGSSYGGTPSDIAEVGTVAVGANPTCIAYVKSFWSTPSDPGNQFVVVSRDQRAIEWVQINGNTGNLFRVLRDTRLVDPIWAEDNDNHGTQSPILTITDYNGRQVSNYRYGPVIYWTNGGDYFGVGPTWQDQFEFGGSYPVAGYPFQVSSSNVP